MLDYRTDSTLESHSWRPASQMKWHNNHHAFPRCAFHGLKSYEYDVTGLIVRGLERLGLVSEVIYPTQALLDRGRR